jgi:hypothetical protein
MAAAPHGLGGRLRFLGFLGLRVLGLTLETLATQLKLSLAPRLGGDFNA